MFSGQHNGDCNRKKNMAWVGSLKLNCGTKGLSGYFIDCALTETAVCNADLVRLQRSAPVHLRGIREFVSAATSMLFSEMDLRELGMLVFLVSYSAG
jgi:hypothetical protein